jgi:hypothetical protein
MTSPPRSPASRFSHVTKASHILNSMLADTNAQQWLAALSGSANGICGLPSGHQGTVCGGIRCTSWRYAGRSRTS